MFVRFAERITNSLWNRVGVRIRGPFPCVPFSLGAVYSGAVFLSRVLDSLCVQFNFVHFTLLRRQTTTIPLQVCSLRAVHVSVQSLTPGAEFQCQYLIYATPSRIPTYTAFNPFRVKLYVFPGS